MKPFPSLAKRAASDNKSDAALSVFLFHSAQLITLAGHFFAHRLQFLHLS